MFFKCHKKSKLEKHLQTQNSEETLYVHTRSFKVELGKNQDKNVLMIANEDNSDLSSFYSKLK